MADHTPTIRDLSPPGDILAEALEERGMTGAELARRLQCSEEHVLHLLCDRAQFSQNLARQLESVLGIPAQLWNSLELHYRGEQERHELL